VQAKASLLYALGGAAERRFNVIRFDDTMSAVPGVRAGRRRAPWPRHRFVSALQAAGGTEMVPAMQAALNDTANAETDHVRQVVFLTDGAIAMNSIVRDHHDRCAAARGYSWSASARPEHLSDDARL